MQNRQKLDYIDHVLEQILNDNLDNKDILVEVARYFIAELYKDNEDDVTL